MWGGGILHFNVSLSEAVLSGHPRKENGHTWGRLTKKRVHSTEKGGRTRLSILLWQKSWWLYMLVALVIHTALVQRSKSSQ